MQLMKYGENTYVLKELTKTINLEDLNLLINKFLKSRNELDINAKVNRAYRHLNYIIVCGYASFCDDIISDVLKIFLTEYDINYVISDLSDEDLKNLKPILPTISVRKNDQHGGVNSDTSSIDPHIKNLSDVLNTYPGIKTFSSCEGHLNNTNEATMYVLFLVDDLKNLDILSRALWHSLEDIMSKYNIFPPELLFDYGDWPNVMSTYFEIRVRYKRWEQKEVFKAINNLAKLLEIEV